MIKRRACLVSLMISAFLAYAGEMKVVNPEPGKWANRQVLVLDVPDDEDAFYSLNGADPATTGFAYDGPVLLDVTGPVELRIASVGDGRIKTDVTVIYTVDPAVPGIKENEQFISMITAKGIIDYKAGTQLEIPSGLKYSMGRQPEAYMAGASLYYSSDCILSRCIPCTVTEGGPKWRFVIRTLPSQSGTFTRRPVPFSISGWDTVLFTDKKCIYKIDDSLWMPVKEPVKIDRSKKHTIAWQSVSFETGNPVQYFELPPKPMLLCTAAPDGAVTAVLRGEQGYRIGVPTGDSAALFEVAGIDTFNGDEIRGTLDAAIYYDSVYQGTLPASYDIDKRSPPVPVISSSALSFYSRKDVNLRIASEADAVVYAAVTGPFPVPEDMIKDEEEKIPGVPEESAFKLLKNASVSLESSSESAVLYRVYAFAADHAGNRSGCASYSVVVDKYNYYLDPSADPAVAEGTKMHPFTSFGQCIPVFKSSRYVHLTVKGTVTVPTGETRIGSNCVIKGTEDARLEFSPGSSLSVQSASLDISGCILERNDKGGQESGMNVPFIKLEHAVLALADCEVTALFNGSGTVISSDTSVINIADSGITAKASSYASCLSAVASKIKMKNIRSAAAAGTAVDFSVQGGEFELRDSLCKITGTYGRTAELFGACSRITDNVFDADLDAGSRTGNAVYADAKSISVEYSRNALQGF